MDGHSAGDVSGPMDPVDPTSGHGGEDSAAGTGDGTTTPPTTPPLPTRLAAPSGIPETDAAAAAMPGDALTPALLRRSAAPMEPGGRVKDGVAHRDSELLFPPGHDDDIVGDQGDAGDQLGGSRG